MLPKFVSEGAATYDELRKRGTSAGAPARSERNVAIVTGGSSGVGAETCRRMVAQDYETISLALRRPDWSDKRLHSVEVDLTDRKATAQAAADVAARFAVTHVVHNAG